MKIYIIEDDADIVESCSLTLRIVWPEIEIVTSKLGREGVQLGKLQPPDIVILDIGLPDINGFEVLKIFVFFLLYLF
jgi:two-component system KDP operon response regulator KdpE